MNKETGRISVYFRKKREESWQYLKVYIISFLFQKYTFHVFSLQFIVSCLFSLRLDD